MVKEEARKGGALCSDEITRDINQDCVRVDRVACVHDWHGRDHGSRKTGIRARLASERERTNGTVV